MSGNAEFTERVRWDGHYSGAVRHVDRRTYGQLKAVERILGQQIVMYQGSWSHGSLSADTHAGAGAADIGPTGRTTWRELETAGRQVGGACWYRPWTNNLHCHFLSVGNPALAPWAKVQVEAYRAGFDGLGSDARGGRDTGTRAYVNVTWQSAQRGLLNSGEELDMATWKKFVRGKAQAIGSPGKYQYLQINEAGDVSWATGPGKIVAAGVNLWIKGLPAGQSVYVRNVVVDLNAAGKVIGRHPGAVVELPGTGGDTFATYTWSGVVGSVKTGQRRVRTELSTKAKGVSIARAEVGYFKI